MQLHPPEPWVRGPDNEGQPKARAANLASVYVKQLLTVFCVTTGRAPYVPHPMAKSGPERSQVGMSSNGDTISERRVLAGYRPNRLVKTGGQDRIELSTFRFSEGLYSPGPRELSTAPAPRCLHKGLSGLTRPC